MRRGILVAPASEAGWEAKTVQRITTRVATIALLMTACLCACGCRLHPISLAVSLVGEAVDDRDVRKRKPLLLNKNSQAADQMFGTRHDTLVDDATGVKWLIYRQPGERFSESFYVVETTPNEHITGLFKCKRNTDGLEDVRKTKIFADSVYGKTPAECENDAPLGELVLAMHSESNGAAARFYRVRDLMHTGGEHYCVLVFSHHNLCEEVRFIGVTAQ